MKALKKQFLYSGLLAIPARVLWHNDQRTEARKNAVVPAKLRHWASLLTMLTLLGLSGCQKEKPISDAGMDWELAIPPGFPPVKFPVGNTMTEERFVLGKKLFFDPVLSIDGSTSCASCHHPELAFSDDQAFSPGAFDRPGTRNAPSLANVGYHPYLLREGSLPTLEMQVLVPIQEHNEFAHNIVDISLELQQDPEYQRMSQAAYAREPDPYVITRAISTFERALISGNSRFDQYRFQGKPSALNLHETRGMELFFSNKTNCSSCHSDFNFTDYSFQNNGLDSIYADPGRMRVTNDPADEALFKVPSLRNVALTAPYMHNAQFSSLEQVVSHYNQGGRSHFNKSPLIRPLGLSETEKGDLIAFLEALTDPQFIGSPRLAH